MHLEQDALGEGLEALTALPEVPVAELCAYLAGGGRTGQHALLVLVAAQGAEPRVGRARLLEQGEAASAGRVREDHGAERRHCRQPG